MQALTGSFALPPTVFKTYEKRYRCLHSKEVLKILIPKFVIDKIIDKLQIGPRGILQCAFRPSILIITCTIYSLNCTPLGPISIINKHGMHV